MYNHGELFILIIKAAFYLLMLSLWTIGIIKIKKNLQQNKLSTIILLTTFSFILLMLNSPNKEELQVQITGATLLSILFGPWISFMLISLGLTIKTIIFNPEAINILAINSFVLAFIPAFTGYYLYKKLLLNTSDKYFSKSLAPAIAAYFSLFMIVLSLALITEIQVISGYIELNMPIGFPFILYKSIFFILMKTLLILGPLEGILTLITVNFLKKEAAFNYITAC